MVFSRWISSQVGTIKVSAKLGSLCGQPTPVILVTDEGLFKSIDATAHGLGFRLYNIAQMSVSFNSNNNLVLINLILLVTMFYCYFKEELHSSK